MAHVTTKKDESRRINGGSCQSAKMAYGMTRTVQEVERPIAEIVESSESTYLLAIRTVKFDFTKISASICISCALGSTDNHAGKTYS